MNVSTNADKIPITHHCVTPVFNAYFYVETPRTLSTVAAIMFGVRTFRFRW